MIVNILFCPEPARTRTSGSVLSAAVIASTPPGQTRALKSISSSALTEKMDLWASNTSLRSTEKRHSLVVTCGLPEPVGASSRSLALLGNSGASVSSTIRGIFTTSDCEKRGSANCCHRCTLERVPEPEVQNLTAVAETQSIAERKGPVTFHQGSPASWAQWLGLWTCFVAYKTSGPKKMRFRMVSSTYYQVSRYHQYQDISSIVPLFFPFYFFPLLATHHAVTTLKPTNRKFPDARLGICQQCVAGFGICHQVSPHHQSQIPWAADRPLTISSSKGTWYNIERWRRNRSYMKRFEKICTNIHHVRHMKVHERSWKPLVYITWHYFLPEISSLCITNHGVQLQ